jgi:protein-S-isoprenylcysteine O-methyltransferase Ste14
MQRLIIRFYALFAYAAFLAAFVYLTGFVAGWGVPKALDDGPSGSPALAVVIDVSLALFFGLAHSVMARAGFKRIWTKVVPAAAERSTYVLVASAQLALLAWQWRPIALEVWTTSGALALTVCALQVTGWTIALLSTYLIDHFELFGLRQAFGVRAQPPRLRTPLLYSWVRHPLYFGTLLAFWSAPTMSAGHLLFSTLFHGGVPSRAWLQPPHPSKLVRWHRGSASSRARALRASPTQPTGEAPCWSFRPGG